MGVQITPLQLIKRLIRHSDTSRCIQGAIIVSNEILKLHRPWGIPDEVKRNQPCPHELASGDFDETREPRRDKDLNADSGLKKEPENNANLGAMGGVDLTRQFEQTTSSEYPAFDNRLNDVKQRECAVPSSRFSRAAGIVSLGIGLAIGSVGELARQNLDFAQGNKQEKMKNRSVILSESNSERIASTLCRMRGAALKLGQMLSIQDESILPPHLSSALERVRNQADVMPWDQIESVLSSELGSNWREKFSDFDEKPFAAASLGQVHKAVLKSSGESVAVKVQFPGVAESIDSDLQNLKRLSLLTGIFPRGLYLDNIVEVMKVELAEECDYEREAAYQTKFKELLSEDSDAFYVPKVIVDASSKRVLTTELAPGLPVDRVLRRLPQGKRNALGRNLLRLTLRELCEFRLMQTDPNFSNYLYDENRDRLVLLDFGATRSYGDNFVDDYVELMWAASNSDRTKILDYSKKLGFLTGSESQEMLNAHIEAGLEVGRPFQRALPFHFGKSKISNQVGKHGDTFMKERLSPPPNEVYSLHRRLSGAYMMCIKMDAVFPCRDLLEQAYERHLIEKSRRMLKSV